MFITFSIYGYFYAYLTTSELKKKTGEALRPDLDLLLILIGCSPYLFYIPYRNQKIIDDWHVKRGTSHKAKALAILSLTLIPFLMVVGVLIASLSVAESEGAMWAMWGSIVLYLGMLISWIVAIFIYQSEQNAFVDIDEASITRSIFE